MAGRRRASRGRGNRGRRSRSRGRGSGRRIQSAASSPSRSNSRMDPNDGRRVRGRGAARGRGGSTNPFSRSPSQNSSLDPFASGPSSASSAPTGTGAPGNPGARPPPTGPAETICAICRNQISNLSITNCNHRFCRDCIRRWTSSNVTCPVCRTNIFAITSYLPDGGTEIIQISRAELLAHKINEIHSILMILFTVMSHTLLPEVSNFLEQLNQIARELNVPTTSSRMESAAAAAESAAQERRSASGSRSSSAGPSQSGSEQSRSASASSSASRSGPAVHPLLTIAMGGLGSRGPSLASRQSPAPESTLKSVSSRMSHSGIASSSLGRESSTSDRSTSVSTSTAPPQQQQQMPMVAKTATKSVPSVAPPSTATTTSRATTPTGRATTPTGTLRPINLSPARTSPRASLTPRRDLDSLSVSSSVSGSTMRDYSATQGPLTRAAAAARMRSQGINQLLGPGMTQVPTAEEVRRILEQRQRDIRFITDSYNKINQVYEVLMFMHMVIHRNQVEVNPPTPTGETSDDD